jgi:hypothetical protein
VVVVTVPVGVTTGVVGTASTTLKFVVAVVSVSMHSTVTMY